MGNLSFTTQFNRFGFLISLAEKLYVWLRKILVISEKGCALQLWPRLPWRQRLLRRWSMAHLPLLGPSLVLLRALSVSEPLVGDRMIPRLQSAFPCVVVSGSMPPKYVAGIVSHMPYADICCSQMTNFRTSTTVPKKDSQDTPAKVVAAERKALSVVTTPATQDPPPAKLELCQAKLNAPQVNERQWLNPVKDSSSRVADIIVDKVAPAAPSTDALGR